MTTLMSEPETDVKVPTGNRRWYSYSFDRETFVGRFASRDEALLGAQDVLRDRSEMPEAIYVARRVPVDLFEKGHGKELVELVRHEARSNGGDVSYIKNLTEDDFNDLDAAVARCIREWAKRRELTPDVEHFEAVSEYPPPLITHVDQPETDEVGQLGPDRS